MIHKIVHCQLFTVFPSLNSRTFSCSPTIHTISPSSKTVEGDGFLMEEVPRSIPMTRQADLSRMPDSRMVRPIRWEPSAIVNCSILTSCVVCSLLVWAFYIVRLYIDGNVQDRHPHRLLPICQMDRGVLLLRVY